MINDAELLEEFSRTQSEAAFKTLVERHLGLVYAVALRKTGRPQMAEDVAQAVFVILAKKASGLKKGTMLTGWLYWTSRLAAAQAIRAEIRRGVRERVAAEFMLEQGSPDEEAKWSEIGPLLDDALGNLRSKDRNAVLLRFFQGQSLADVGSALGCTEEAARKRIDRAIERLRTFFKRRGALVSTAALASAIEAHAQTVPPTGLSHAACAAAVSQSATASATILHLVTNTMRTMFWSKAPFGIALVVPIVLLVAVPLVLRGQPGLVDPDFTSRLPITGAQITALALQSGGRIVVGGNFSSFPRVGGTEYSYLGLARLEPDGQVDIRFSNFDERGVYALAVQKDDKIVVGGNWTTTNAAKHANICRLNADGTIDSTFNPGQGTDWRPPPAMPNPAPFSSLVRTIALQADGKILIGGDFHQIAGEDHPALARLNPGGSVDLTFIPPTRSGDQVQRVLVQPDGKLVVSATFKGGLPSQVQASVLRLNADGSVDPTFHQSAELRRTPLALQSNGRLIAALNRVDLLDLTEPVRLVRLNPDGQRDSLFNATLSLTNVDRPYPQLFALVSAPGGKTIVLGRFNRVNGLPQNDLARLNADGTLDTTFQGGSGFEPPPDLNVNVGPALLQPDGKTLFGGSLGKVNGVGCQSLCRVLGDPPPRFQNLRFSANSLQALLSPGGGADIYLESSRNLQTWTRTIAIPDPRGNLSLDLSAGGESALFYRAISE